MPAGWDPGSERRWQVRWTEAQGGGWLVRVWVPTQACAWGTAETVEPEGLRVRRRALPALFPTAAATFFGPLLSSASPQDCSQHTGALGRPKAWHWALRSDLAPGEQGCRSTSKGPLLLPLRPMWPPSPYLF